MSIRIEYRIVEHYDDEAPEPFGFELIPARYVPKPGDVIMLHWLDGREAYQVKVDEVRGTTLHVRQVR